ncbi:unnamed protein product [Amoebophrya sp. A120]|nr:unnamed protein product [Amoebophrya sp. A120]|eukprot:GSA120T00007883001.1
MASEPSPAVEKAEFCEDRLQELLSSNVSIKASQLKSLDPNCFQRFTADERRAVANVPVPFCRLMARFVLELEDRCTAEQAGPLLNVSLPFLMCTLYGPTDGGLQTFGNLALSEWLRERHAVILEKFRGAELEIHALFLPPTKLTQEPLTMTITITDTLFEQIFVLFEREDRWQRRKLFVLSNPSFNSALSSRLEHSTHLRGAEAEQEPEAAHPGTAAEQATHSISSEETIPVADAENIEQQDSDDVVPGVDQQEEQGDGNKLQLHDPDAEAIHRTKTSTIVGITATASSKEPRASSSSTASTALPSSAASTRSSGAFPGILQLETMLAGRKCDIHQIPPELWREHILKFL